MAFDIRKYIAENKIELGSIKKEVGDSTFKGGHNDLRKTQYDVKLTEDGKLDLYTHKSIVTEGKKKLNEDSGFGNKLYSSLEIARKLLNDIELSDYHEHWQDAKRLASDIEKFIKKSKLK